VTGAPCGAHAFVIVGVALLVLGIQPHGSLWILAPAFLVIAFVLSAAADMESVYPSEVFPTEVRASGVGLAAAISRAGAATSTFLLPIILDHAGIGPTMFILAAVVGLGVAISIPLAPEIRGIILDRAAPDRRSGRRDRLCWSRTATEQHRYLHLSPLDACWAASRRGRPRILSCGLLDRRGFIFEGGI
jgi:MFS family permease